MKILCHTPIFDLIEGPEVQPNFKPVQIKSNDWVAICVELEGKFLFVKQLRYGIMQNMTEFPCGIVEDDENPRDTIVRELKEETGYEVHPDDVVFLGKRAANPAFMTNYMHYFYINLDFLDKSECYEGDVKHNTFRITRQNLDINERIEFYWDWKDSANCVFNQEECSVVMEAFISLLKKYNVVR